MCVNEGLMGLEQHAGEPKWQNGPYFATCLCLSQCVCETWIRPALFPVYAEAWDAGAAERVCVRRKDQRRLQHLHNPHQLHKLVPHCPGETRHMVFCVMDSSPSLLHLVFVPVRSVQACSSCSGAHRGVRCPGVGWRVQSSRVSARQRFPPRLHRHRGRSLCPGVDPLSHPGLHHVL